MLNAIYDWEPQISYKGYDNGKMYNMDYVAKVVLESDYKPIVKTLKEYVIAVIELANYWYCINFNNPQYSLHNEEQVKNLIGSNFPSFDNGHFSEVHKRITEKKKNLLNEFEKEYIEKGYMYS